MRPLLIVFLFSASCGPLAQISDAVLDACLEQDPDSKVRAAAVAAPPNGLAAVVSGGQRLAAGNGSRMSQLLTRRMLGGRFWRHEPSLAVINKLNAAAPCRESQVACETCTKTNMVMVFGEITTKAKVDYEAVVRTVCKEVGFTSADVGLDGEKCKVSCAGGGWCLLLLQARVVGVILMLDGRW